MTTATATIFALSSAPGRAGVAVIRVSGPSVREVLGLMAPPLQEPGRAAFRTIRHPQTHEPLDSAIALFFAAPKSETGEDVAEFQVHGGRAVVAAVLEALGQYPGCRIAEPGEFARRAFLNGKLDLAAVEGLADLVDAETEAQRRQALAQSSGALSKIYDGWRERLLQAMALMEASIDFSDEGDVVASATAAARALVAPLAGEIAAHLADGRRGEILREGFRVALLGAPNAGKSSLLNALARREAAIVSDEAGTTRDIVEVRLDLGGYPVIVSDTAGLRDDAAAGAIEREGMRRSRAAATAADLVLWLVEPGGIGLAPAGESLPESSAVSRETAAPILMVRTKADKLTEQEFSQAAGSLLVSVRSGQGLDALVAHITCAAKDRLAARAGPPLTRERYRAALTLACESLSVFLSGADGEPELRAEDLRLAAHALGRITGRVDVEDVLGEIFGRFCIGK